MSEMKQCNQCKEFKPTLLFRVVIKHRTISEDSYRYIRPTCRSCENQNNSDRHKRNYRNTEKHKTASYRHRIKKYGLTVEQFEKMMEDQKGSCAICNRELPLVIDHCHNTGKVRKLLCTPCNIGLGSFGDDIERLRKAIEYLDE